MTTRSIPLLVRSYEKRSATFVASTDAIDSYGEIVEQVWDLARYRANPIVLYGHQSRELPIGMCTAVGVSGGKLECTIQFATANQNPVAERVWQLVQAQILRAVSVGFAPRTVRRETRDGKEVTVLSDNELHEISVVTIPANPEALAKMKALGPREPTADLGDIFARQLYPSTHVDPSDTLGSIFEREWGPTVRSQPGESLGSIFERWMEADDDDDDEAPDVDDAPDVGLPTDDLGVVFAREMARRQPPPTDLGEIFTALMGGPPDEGPGWSYDGDDS